MKRLDKSEVIFTILAYTIITVFALFCLYPFVFTIAVALSSETHVIAGDITLLPKGLQFDAFEYVITDKRFWIAYSNTLFMTFYGTIVSMFISVTGAYALSKRRLLFRKQLNFLLVFTLWFAAGMIPTYTNYTRFNVDNRWGIIYAMGVQTFNIILLRNAFEAVPKELEEAAQIDGANEFQILTKVYLPMSKAVLATVTLFYGLSRWNGYFWSSILLKDIYEQPLQVYLRGLYKETETEGYVAPGNFAVESMVYTMIIASIIPIIIVYPYLQKYFARGMNVGGVKG